MWLKVSILRSLRNFLTVPNLQVYSANISRIASMFEYIGLPYGMGTHGCGKMSRLFVHGRVVLVRKKNKLKKERKRENKTTTKKQQVTGTFSQSPHHKWTASENKTKTKPYIWLLPRGSLGLKSLVILRVIAPILCCDLRLWGYPFVYIWITDCTFKQASNTWAWLDIACWLVALPGALPRGQTKVMKSFSVKDLGKSRASVYSKDLPFISLGKQGCGEQASEKRKSGRWGRAPSNAARVKIYGQEERWMCYLRCILYHSPCPPFW